MSWTEQNITPRDVATSVFAVDVDGDGDMDILTSAITGVSVAWHENVDGKGECANAITRAAS